MIINTGLCNSYILDIQENKAIVYDVAGTGFPFNTVEQAVQFMYQAKSYDDSRLEIYNKIK